MEVGEEGVLALLEVGVSIVSNWETSWETLGAVDFIPRKTYLKCKQSTTAAKDIERKRRSISGTPP